jgi:nucleoside-diphosphate-sugar epimerase
MHMKALVTGSGGFIGRHMTRALVERGYAVNCWDLAEGNNALHLFDADEARYELVVHCAYHVGGRAAIDGEPRLLAKNLELDAAMFDWAVRTGQRVLYFSSSAAYPVDLQDDLAFARELREDDIRLNAKNIGRPDARYGWAKLTGEQLAKAATEAGIVVHIVRPFSGYGEDQSLDYPFPSIVQRAHQGDLSVWGPPGQTRDWIHVSDVVAGALAVVDQDVRDPVNLCTGIGTEMGQLALMVAEAAGIAAGEVEYLADRPTGVAFRVGDPTRMHQIYKPAVTLQEGIARALARS